MTIRPDPELERIKQLLLILAGNDEALLASAIDEVMAERGEIPLEVLIDKIIAKVEQPQRDLIQKAREAAELTAA